MSTKMRNMTGILSTALAVMAIVIGSLVVSRAEAQEPTPTPLALPVEDRLQMRVYTQAMEIAQLKAQAAQRDFDAAKSSAMELMKRSERSGYTIDWERGVYTPVPKEQKP